MSRRLVLSMMVSLDGHFEGPGEGWEVIDWHHADDEWHDHAVALLGRAGLLLFGRVTYEGFAGYWSSAEGEVARRLNALPKAVVSTTLTAATWGPARLIGDRVVERVAAIKAEPGPGDIVLLGSGTLASTLQEHGLIDEYQLALNPVVLGAGRPLFRPGLPRLPLRLTGSRVFGSGLVLGTYEPRSGAAG